MMIFAVIVSTTICIFADCVCELFDKWMFGGECMRGEMDLREEYLIYSLWYTQTNNRLTIYWKQEHYTGKYRTSACKTMLTVPQLVEYVCPYSRR